MKKKVFPPTTKKAASHTSDHTNQDIRNKTIIRIEAFKESNEEILADRMDTLDHEWDLERALEANAALIVLISSILGFQKERCGWFLLSGAVGFFLLQHALQGWCPPLPLYRNLGVRTAEEINQEKMVLKYLRGDFAQNTTGVANDLLGLAEK